MKDKRAYKKKQQRRREREAEFETKKDDLYEKYRSEMKKSGIKARWSKDYIWQEYKRTTMEVYKKSIMAALICTMHCLHKNEGWGCDRLWRLFDGTARIITAIGSEERNVSQLASELIYDAGVDIKAIVGDYKPWNGEDASKHLNVTYAGAMLENIVPAMVIVLFELYNQFGWKKKRMNRIAGDVKDVYIYALENNKLDEVRRGLEQDLKIMIEYDGNLRR
jgi:hypothetical protein